MMNRRESLKALTIGSLGAAIPFKSWSNPAPGEPASGTGLEPTAARPADWENGVAGDYGSFFLVAGKEMEQMIPAKLAPFIKFIPKESFNKDSMIAALAQGGSMVWIGSGEHLPPELSIGAFSPSTARLVMKAAESSPLPLDGITLHTAVAQSGYIAFPQGDAFS